MHEEIMRVQSADIRDNDHGEAVIEIDLRATLWGQSAIFPVNPTIAYKLLVVFQVEYLSKAAGKYCRVLREEPSGLIKGLGNLPCDPWIEVYTTEQTRIST